MSSRGIVRRIDDLGRVVIPKETRKMLGFDSDTPLEFYLDKEKIVIKPYDMGRDIIKKYGNPLIQSIFDSINKPIFITDSEKYLAKGISNDTAKSVFDKINKGEKEELSDEYPHTHIMTISSNSPKNIIFVVFSDKKFSSTEEKYLNVLESVYQNTFGEE